MWTCDACGRSFANTAQWHSCTDLTAEDRLADESPLAVACYEAVVDALGEHGPFRVHPQQTRIAFITTMTFAGVSFAARWVDLSFVTATVVNHDRVRRLEVFGPTSFASTVRIEGPGEVDGEVRGWLGRAYARGHQETLDRDAVAEPVRPPVVDVLRVPVAATVRIEPDGSRYLAVPAYAAGVFGHRSDVQVAFAGGGNVLAMTERVADRPAVVGIDSALAHRGLGEGDRVDVTLHPVVFPEDR